MRRLVFPVLMMIIGCAVLVALGLWQVQRLAQKQEVLAAIEARIHDAPGALPAQPREDQDEYSAVAVRGMLTGDALYVLHARAGQSPAYRMIAPLNLGPRRVLVDLGLVEAAQRSAPAPSGPLSVTGNLHWPDEVSRWTPSPDGDQWFARDVPAMAQALNTDPVLVVARAHSRPDLSTAPIAVDSSHIPNDHLSYAITWFGLAFVWALMSLLLIRRTLRSVR